MIKILEPDLSGNELKYLTECINEGWVSSKGSFVTAFEKIALQSNNPRRCLSTANGTVALHLALVTLGIGEGDEVIVPNMTFGATVNAVLYTGATPVFVDVCEHTWNMELKHVIDAQTPNTKAVIPVALFGNPSGIKELCTWASLNGVISIIDAAEAVGSTIDNLDIGCFGDAVTYSYFGNKTITTGEGGAVIFKDPSKHERALVLRDHGMCPDRRYHHEVIGFNYRMTNMQAAVGVAQYERLQDILLKRKKIVNNYKMTLNPQKFQFQHVSERCASSNWVFTVKICEPHRQNLEQALAKENIEVRRAFELMSEQPAFVKTGILPRKTPIARALFDELLLLPTHSGLSDGAIEKICQVLNESVD